MVSPTFSNIIFTPANWYDYGARFYDPVTARFTTPDPMAEAYYSQSPYAYAANNPIRYIDYQGMGPNDAKFLHWAKNNPMGAIAEGFRQFFDATASLFTVNTGANISNSNTLVGLKSKSFSTSASIVKTSRIDVKIDASKVFDYDGNNEKTMSQMDIVKLESSATTELVHKAEVDLKPVKIPAKVSITEKTNLETGDSSTASEISTGVSSGNGNINTSANLYLNTTTTNSDGNKSTTVAVGGQVNAEASQGNKSVSVGVYLEVERKLDRK